MANIITCIRVLCSIGMLFVPVFSPTFYILYLIAGVSDMIDGMVARKRGTASAFGAKLDTVADLVMVTVCLIKLIPVSDLPLWLIIWIAVIALIKVINVVSGYVMRKEFVTVHTVMNKVTGILLFILPLTWTLIDVKYSGIAVSAVATFAAIREGHLIRTGAIRSVIIAERMNCDTSSVSVAIKEVAKEAWKTDVRDKSILSDEEFLYKKPDYTCDK